MGDKTKKLSPEIVAQLKAAIANSGLDSDQHLNAICQAYNHLREKNNPYVFCHNLADMADYNYTFPLQNLVINLVPLMTDEMYTALISMYLSKSHVTAFAIRNNFLKHAPSHIRIPYLLNQ